MLNHFSVAFTHSLPFPYPTFTFFLYVLEYQISLFADLGVKVRGQGSLSILHIEERRDWKSNDVSKEILQSKQGVNQSFSDQKEVGSCFTEQQSQCLR